MNSIMIDTPSGSGVRARLRAYSSFEPYELADYIGALASRLPDVALCVERMPTAALTDRLLAEKTMPAADLVLGWADTASRTAGLETIELNPPGYVRPTGFSTAFVIDPDVLSQIGVPIRTWRDLADPRLRGRIVFPDPAISGAGFLALATLLQFLGEDAGWSLLEAICRNVAEFPGSAWAPAERSGDGRIAAGVTVKIAAARRVRQAPVLKIVEPTDVVGAEAEVYGGLASTAHPKIVGEIIDWLHSDDARSLFDSHLKTDLRAPANNLFMIDAGRAVADRARWLDRFGSLKTGDAG